MKKELPEISINEWLQAEESLAIERAEPQPAGSVTTDQYAQATGRTMGHARKVLLDLVRAGKAERRRWHSGSNGPRMIYFLKSKKSLTDSSQSTNSKKRNQP